MATTPASAEPKTNRIGLTVIDYKGGKTTLCAGCGHNAISERIIEAMYDMGVQPERVAKLSGIGCSSKSPAYFMNRSHSFNSVHGRMPSVATGAMLANRNLIALGVSGDGDTASIGIGQFVHLMRRNLPMIYIIEDNGVYGLTKGQFSATADLGSKLKSGVINDLPPIDTCGLAIELGRNFCRPLVLRRQAPAEHHAESRHRPPRHRDARRGLALRHLQRSRRFHQILQIREGSRRGLAGDELRAALRGNRRGIRSRNHGQRHHARRLPACNCASWKKITIPTDRIAAMTRLTEAHDKGEVLTGIFYVNTKAPSFLDMLNMVDQPLATLPESMTRPGKEALDAAMEELR